MNEEATEKYHDLLNAIMGHDYVSKVEDQYSTQLSDNIILGIASKCYDDHVTRDNVKSILEMNGCGNNEISSILLKIDSLDEEYTRSLIRIIDDYNDKRVDAKSASLLIISATNISLHRRCKSLPNMVYSKKSTKKEPQSDYIICSNIVSLIDKNEIDHDYQIDSAFIDHRRTFH